MNRLQTRPPEPLGCREWRAFFDPEGPQGTGKTEAAAIRDLVIEQVENWKAHPDDLPRIVAALEAKP
jgi:hypothetical protein